MDWTRRRFLWSTALIAAVTGCQQSESEPTQMTSSDTGSVPQTATSTEAPTTLSTPTPATSPPDSPTATRSNDQTPTKTDLQTGSDTTTQDPTQSEIETERPASQPTSEGAETETEQTVSEDTETGTTPEDTPTKPQYVGTTIPQIPHAPVGTPPPTGTNFRASAATPVLRASDVTDYGDVDYVADPFMFVEDGSWHMFFEIVNENRQPDAPIGHATSPNGLNWTYDRTVLKKRYHTSFPLVWKHRGSYYMCPPTGKRVELYKARRFPTDWRHIGNAIDVDYYPHDPTFIRYQDRWWLFTDRGNDGVMVYHSRDLEREGWTPHKQNPVVTDRLRAGRQGGRPMVVGDRLFLYFQDSVEHYGNAIRCYEVPTLSTARYRDREMPGSPVLYEFGTGWTNNGMHTFDPWWRGPDKGWRCAVDGVRAQDSVADLWTIGIVDIPPQ